MKLPAFLVSLSRILPTLAATSLAAPSLAAAEQHNLYRHNGWKVDLLVRDDSSLACVAGTYNDKDEFFAVRIDPESDVSVNLVFRNPQSGVRPLNLSIHGVKDWTFNEFDTFFFGGSFTFRNDDAAQDFLEDLARGRALSVSSPSSDRVFTRFLIEGSGPALDSLAECFALIRGPGV
jgi:hypothetical protein